MYARKLLIAIAFSFFSPLAMAHSGLEEGDAEIGKATFEENCANCHYEDDFADEADSVLEAILLAILNGEIRHRGGFRGLSEKDIANLAAFLEDQ